LSAFLHCQLSGFFFLIFFSSEFMISKAKASTERSQNHRSFALLCGTSSNLTCEFEVTLGFHIKPVLYVCGATYLTSRRRMQKLPVTAKIFTPLLSTRQRTFTSAFIMIYSASVVYRVCVIAFRHICGTGL
jgi:hypothetical protein